MNSNKWTHITLPREVADRLRQHAAEIQTAHERGQTILPTEFADRCPLHHVVTRLLDEVEARRNRSRRPRRAAPVPRF